MNISARDMVLTPGKPPRPQAAPFVPAVTVVHYVNEAAGIEIDIAIKTTDRETSFGLPIDMMHGATVKSSWRPA
jgi:hypothetical protein